MNLRAIAPVLMFLVLSGCVSLEPGPTTSPAAATPPASTTQPTVPLETLPPGVTARPHPTLPFDVVDILTASLSVTNMSDEDMTVKVGARDPETDEILQFVNLTLRPFETISQESVAAQYKVEFGRASSASPQVCLLEVQDGESYSFVGLVSNIAVTRAGTDPATTADLIVGTSPLCQAWFEPL